MIPHYLPASQVRTGYAIRSPWDGYRAELEVEVVIWSSGKIWFTGWSSTGERVERGWGQRPDTQLLVTTDYGEQAKGWGTV